MERWHFHRHGFLENGVIRCRTNQNRHRKSWQNVPLKTVSSLTDVTIENVLNDNLYNDLGFIVNNKRMILKEAQAAWTMNILVRIREQTKQYGMTQKAVTETIRMCEGRNILREYLPDREKEIVTIMMSLFDEEQIMKSFIKSERHDEARETA